MRRHGRRQRGDDVQDAEAKWQTRGKGPIRAIMSPALPTLALSGREPRGPLQDHLAKKSDVPSFDFPPPPDPRTRAPYEMGLG